MLRMEQTEKTCVGYQNQAQLTGYQFGTSTLDQTTGSPQMRNQLNNQRNKNASRSEQDKFIAKCQQREREVVV